MDVNYGICRHITENKLYFADVGDLVDCQYDLTEAKQKMLDWFEEYVVEYDPEDDKQSKIYRTMMVEYERIEHLLRYTERRLNNL